MEAHIYIEREVTTEATKTNEQNKQASRQTVSSNNDVCFTHYRAAAATDGVAVVFLFLFLFLYTLTYLLIFLVFRISFSSPSLSLHLSQFVVLCFFSLSDIRFVRCH